MDKIAIFTFRVVLLTCLAGSTLVQAKKDATAASANTEQRIADLKCKEYSDFAFQQNQPAVAKTVSPTETSPEFPHMSLIGFDGTDGTEWLCGASLISESYVLTAAHCLYSRGLGEAKHVRIGDLNFNTDDGRAIDVKIASRIAHPDYLQPQSFYNDIGLVKLEKPIEFNRYIYPACLHSTKAIAGKTARASFWRPQDFAGSLRNHVLKVDLELVTFAACNGTYKATRKLPKGIDDESQFCAGSSLGHDACQGDTGGPLQIIGQNNPYIQSVIGVTSFGKSCGVPTVPTLCTRVSHFVPWIESIVWP